MLDIGINHKTIFVLDHTQYFSLSSEEYLSLDAVRTKPPVRGSDNEADAPLPKFSKSLWTTSVEAAVEYCRIVYDLFPTGKFVRFFVSDTVAHIVNTWNSSTQNISHVLNAMALVGIPPRNAQSSEFSVIHGMRAAVEALSEPTEDQIRIQQMDYRNKFHAAAKKNVDNKGRIICITSANDNNSIKALSDTFHSVLQQQNKLAASQKKALIIDHCNLVIINVFPQSKETLVTIRGTMFLSLTMSTEVINTTAPNLSNKLTQLIMIHYDLASTTVTGIPMKEEQNANSSANYDVEILHARHAHTVFGGKEAFLPTSIKEGSEHETVTLKWSTPRSCGACESQTCLAQHRVTPVDVTSRPSACLINFLLNGRSVLLEMPIKSCGKSTSHLLSARGGDIFIHALQITRSCLEDLPSILDGPGGRATDYRVVDFTSLIKVQRLVPQKNNLQSDENLYHARDIIFRNSRYFPLTLNNSLVYNLERNINWLQVFLQKIAKSDMDKADESLCQQYLFDLYSAARRSDVLPILNAPARGKGVKTVEHYKLLWAELEVIMRVLPVTLYHRTILDGLRAMYVEELLTKIEPAESRTTVGPIIATTDSPMSPPLVTPSTSSASTSRAPKRRTLHDMAVAAEQQSTKRFDFFGRINTPIGQTAKLYENLTTKDQPCTSSSIFGMKKDDNA